jgi:hypothetical protein
MCHSVSCLHICLSLIWRRWQWLLDLRLSECEHGVPDGGMALLAQSLLDRVVAERLEGCSALHLAALSGDYTMVRVAPWVTVFRADP